MYSWHTENFRTETYELAICTISLKSNNQGLPLFLVFYSQYRGRPPLLLELDAKLIQFLQAVRRKGGVINIHVVRATAEALLKCNPVFAQQLSRFEMPCSWVQSLYRRMKFTRRAGTTSRPPVPMGIYKECWSEYLRDVDQKMKLYSIYTSWAGIKCWSDTKFLCFCRKADNGYPWI